MDNFATYSRPVLEDGELVISLAVRPELPMQLISVRDIGALAAIASDRPDQFVGRTVEVAGDILTPPQIAETFGRVCGMPARFCQTPIEQIRAFDVQLPQMFTFFSEHPSELADLSALRAEHSGLMRLETWLQRPGGNPEHRKRADMTDGLLLLPGGGRKIQAMTLKAGAEQSKIWSAFEADVAPGFDVGAHLHEHAEEVFYVLEGELDLLPAGCHGQRRLAHLGVRDRGHGVPGRAGEFHVRSR
jgi:hypothetical protein